MKEGEETQKIVSMGFWYIICFIQINWASYYKRIPRVLGHSEHLGVSTRENVCYQPFGCYWNRTSATGRLAILFVLDKSSEKYMWGKEVKAIPLLAKHMRFLWPSLCLNMWQIKLPELMPSALFHSKCQRKP